MCYSKHSVLLCIYSWWFIERYLAADSVWNLSSARWKRQRDCYWWHVLYWSSKLMSITLNFKQKMCSFFSICNANQHYLWMLNMRLHWWHKSCVFLELWFKDRLQLHHYQFLMSPFDNVVTWRSQFQIFTASLHQECEVSCLQKSTLLCCEWLVFCSCDSRCFRDLFCPLFLTGQTSLGWTHCRAKPLASVVTTSWNKALNTSPLNPLKTKSC